GTAQEDYFPPAVRRQPQYSNRTVTLAKEEPSYNNHIASCRAKTMNRAERRHRDRNSPNGGKTTTPLLGYWMTWLMIAGAVAGIVFPSLSSTLVEIHKNSLAKELATTEARAYELSREGEKALEQQDYDTAALRFNKAVQIYRETINVLES